MSCKSSKIFLSSSVNNR